MTIVKTKTTHIKCADDEGREYIITKLTPYEAIQSLDETEIIEKLGCYSWNGTKINPPKDDVFYIPQIDTKVKKIS